MIALKKILTVMVRLHEPALTGMEFITELPGLIGGICILLRIDITSADLLFVCLRNYLNHKDANGLLFL